MVSSLVLTLESGSRWDWEDVGVREDFEDLKLGDKYGFELGWLTVRDKIHILWRYVSGWETQIYLADTKRKQKLLFVG